MLHRLALVVFLLVLLELHPRAAQQSAGGARINGEVLDAGSGTPVKNARVILRSRASVNQREALTDDKGLFVVEDVEPGTYLIHAERTGYVSDRLPAGFARPIPLAVNIEARRSYALSFRLIRAAAISGRVYDVDRQPVANAEIQILLPRYNGFGERTLTRLNIVSPTPGGYPSVQTDTEGEYQVSGIPPGEYYIRAAYGAEPAVRGGLAVRANNAAPTYYPGVTSPDEAVSIKVTGGLDIHAIDFTLAPVSPIKVAGRIVNPFIQAERGTYSYYLVPRNAKLMEGVQPVPNHSAKEGEFELRNVRPGPYELYVAFQTGDRPEEFRFYTGRARIDVTDHDITELTIAIEPGVQIPGRIVFDEAAQRNPNISSIYPLFGTLNGMPGILSPTAIRGRSNFVQPDGTFVIPNAASGRYFLTMVLDGASDLYVTSARLGTEEILGKAFEVDSDTTGPLVIEVSGMGGRMQGTVIDKDGAPVAGAQVMLVPPINFREDQTAYKNAFTDERGHFTISGIRPGRYNAYTLFPREDIGAWMNPDFITPFLSSAVEVNVSSGQNIERELRLIVLPQ